MYHTLRFQQQAKGGSVDSTRIQFYVRKPKWHSSDRRPFCFKMSESCRSCIEVSQMPHLRKAYYVMQRAVGVQPSKDSTTTMSTKGQLTIPSHIRERLALRPSDK